MTTWTPKGKDVETWTPKAVQTETWLSERPTRAFDPYGFSRSPDFSTGSTSGIWDVVV